MSSPNPSLFPDADFLRYGTIASEHVSRQVLRIKSPELLAPANAFERSVSHAAWQMVLPLLTAANLLTGIEKAWSWSKALKELAITDVTTLSDEEQAEVKRLARRLLDEDEAFAEWRKSRDTTRDAILNDLLRETPQFVDACRATVYSTLSGAWTAFECLAKDTWITLLNTHPSFFAQNAFRGLDKNEEGLTKRTVPVGLLSRYGFNVSNRLGDLLEDRFDFTSVRGTCNAYRAIFGKDLDLAKLVRRKYCLKHRRRANQLERLEAIRHVVVHRGGVVDERFVERFGGTQKSGDLLRLEALEFETVVNSTIVSGCRLLHSVDMWLTKNRHRLDP
jgi:hypothetical protein